MAEHHRLRQLSLEELAAEMGGVQEGALSWSKYVAEFKRRAASQQRVSLIIAVTSVVVSALAIVAGSAVTVREHVMPIHPPAADLVVQAKPILDAAALESEIVGARHDVALETWGEAGWAQVARLCQYHREMGMKGLSCPSPPELSPRPG